MAAFIVAFACILAVGGVAVQYVLGISMFTSMIISHLFLVATIVVALSLFREEP